MATRNCTFVPWRTFFADLTLFEKVLQLPRPLGPHSRRSKTNEGSTRTTAPLSTFIKDDPPLFSLPLALSLPLPARSAARSFAFLRLRRNRARLVAFISDAPCFQATARLSLIKRINRKRRDPGKASTERKGVRLPPLSSMVPFLCVPHRQPFGYLSCVVHRRLYGPSPFSV